MIVVGTHDLIMYWREKRTSSQKLDSTHPFFVSGGGLGARYILNQFHFHWSDELQYGSEHTIDEARYPLEVLLS